VLNRTGGNRLGSAPASRGLNATRRSCPLMDGHAGVHSDVRPPPNPTPPKHPPTPPPVRSRSASGRSGRGRAAIGDVISWPALHSGQDRRAFAMAQPSCQIARRVVAVAPRGGEASTRRICRPLGLARRGSGSSSPIQKRIVQIGPCRPKAARSGPSAQPRRKVVGASRLIRSGLLAKNQKSLGDRGKYCGDPNAIATRDR